MCMQSTTLKPDCPTCDCYLVKLTRGSGLVMVSNNPEATPAGVKWTLYDYGTGFTNQVASMLLPWEMHSKTVTTMFHDDPTLLGLVLMLHPCLGFSK